MTKAKDRFAPVMKKALEMIKPKGKGIPKSVISVREAINYSLKKNKVSAKAELGGSFAKGTHLEGDYDVDIFVRFNKKKHAEDDLSNLLEKALAGFSPERIHGSRDYFQFSKDRIQYEIVPVLNIKKPNEAKNVTDCSPLHVSWVAKNIKRKHDDIRLAKRFMKCAEVYGAESYIRGFSGHVVDLLVIMNGGFLALLQKASGWQAPVVIDYLNAHKGRALAKLNPAKTQSPLIIVDPVQPDRNASASLSKERFDSFIEAAKRFLQNPDISFFEMKEINLADLAKKGPTVVAIATPLAGKEDVVGSKLLQAKELIEKELEEFGVTESNWHWKPGEAATFVYLLKTAELPATKTIEGPPSRIREHVIAFKMKHPTAKDVDGKMVAIENRTARTPKQVLEPAVSGQYIKERVKKISISTLTPRE